MYILESQSNAVGVLIFNTKVVVTRFIQNLAGNGLGEFKIINSKECTISDLGK